MAHGSACAQPAPLEQRSRRARLDDPAAAFRQTRAAHQAETAEDYVKLVAKLIDAHGEARSTDLAKHLGITSASVTSTIARLQRDGLIEHRPYRSIFLTKAGRELAEMARRRHRLVVEFLRALGVSERAAEQDAEGIEHHISPETFDAFTRFIEASRC